MRFKGQKVVIRREKLEIQRRWPAAAAKLEILPTRKDVPRISNFASRRRRGWQNFQFLLEEWSSRPPFPPS